MYQRWLTHFACIAVVTGLAGCKAASPPQSRGPQQVRILTVSPAAYAPRIALTGVIAAQVQSDWSFRISGRVVERKADVGQHVEKGEVLARVDPVSQAADLAAAKASVVSNEAQLLQAQAVFDRQKDLLGKGFTTQRTYDQAEQALRVAQAAVDSARAQQGTAADALTYSDLKAGASGIITARKVDVGEVAQAAQTVFTIAEDGPRDAIFEVNEALVSGRAKPPQVDVALVGHPEIATIGTVRQVAPTVDPQNGTVRVKIKLDVSPPEMTLGAPVIGSVVVEGTQAVTLPSTAMSSLKGHPAVWILDATSQQVSLRAVKVLAYETGKFVVGEGLVAGERVIVDGGKLLRPGETVQPIGDAT